MSKYPVGITPYALRREYDAQVDHSIRAGEFSPSINLWSNLSIIIWIIYLLVPHGNRPLLKYARYLVFAFHIFVSVCTMRYCRARNIAAACGLGIVSSWSMIWGFTLLIANDPQVDFQRIQRRDETEKAISKKHSQPHLNDHVSNDSKELNGTTKGSYVSSLRGISLNKNNSAHGPKKPKTCTRYIWQPFPLESFRERLDWVLEIIFNYRGIGWNWQIQGIPLPPKDIQEELRTHPGTARSSRATSATSSVTMRHQPRIEVVYTNLKIFIKGYLLLDLLKVIVLHDPYLWGVMNGPPPGYLPKFAANSPTFLRMYRLMFIQFGVKIVLETIFSMVPLIFVGILGATHAGVRGESWMHPPYFGSYTNVLDRGIAGWWGGWWHQTFRFAFEQHSRVVVKFLRIDTKSSIAKALRLMIAFSMSGIIHACGSYTLPGHTNPVSGSFLFFFVQSFGIMTEMLVLAMLQKINTSAKVPKVAQQIITFIYVHIWFYFTAHLLSDDWASGGLWLLEPIPLSPLRALGLGIPGSRWWCWGDWGIFWHTGGWMKSGLVI